MNKPKNLHVLLNEFITFAVVFSYDYLWYGNTGTCTTLHVFMISKAYTRPEPMGKNHDIQIVCQDNTTLAYGGPSWLEFEKSAS